MPKEATKWYFELMNDRTIVSKLNGESVEKKLRRGVGQGLVLSSTCWNLCFDPILRKLELENKGIKVIAYADDAIIIATGICPVTLRDNLQRTINTFVRWGNESGLSFSHEKTEAVIFPPKGNRKKWTAPSCLKVKGNTVPYSDTIKYLGVTFRSDMDWSPYVNDRIKKGKNLLFMQRNIVGKSWGVNPKLSKWLYTGIVRPIVTYAAHIWSHNTNKETNRKLLQLNRLGCMLIAGIEKSNPTTALQIIYDILPIDLYLRERAISTQIRTKKLTRGFWSGQCPNGKLSSKEHWNREIRRNNLEYKTDKTSIRTKNKAYTLKPFDKSSNLTETKDILYVYSDGSKLEGRVGFGGVIRENDVNQSEFLGQLNPSNSVYQAEVKGIIEGALILQGKNTLNKSIVFRVDNQAALLSLTKKFVESKLVHRCYIELRKLCINNNVTLEWVKAHSEVTPEGNETADANAKLGTTSITIHNEIHPPHALIKTQLKAKIRNEWQTQWNNPEISGKLTQSRRLLSGPRSDIAQTIDGCSRQMTREIVAIITGHGPNLHNQVNKKFAFVNICRLCLECDDETSWHILCECPALNQWRHKTMGFHNYNGQIMHDWKPKNLKKFLKSESLLDICYPPLIERHPP